ncbi:DUF6602 domain-containing protein [Bradyrhizobium sp. 1.29L]
MTHPQVQERFRNEVAAAVAKFKETAAMSHAGVKGKFREIFVSDLLSRILSSDFIAGSGVVVDAAGGTSQEADVIIFDKFHVPAVLYSERDGLFPIEGVYYYGEVKSRLTKQELRDSVQKFRSLLAMSSLPNVRGQRMIGPRFLFAWSSDLKEETIEAELARYIDVDQEAMTLSAATIICVVGKGYCYADPVQGQVVWYKCGVADGLQEVVNFVGGIANSLVDFRFQRFGTRFGHYIIPEGDRVRLL